MTKRAKGEVETTTLTIRIPKNLKRAVRACAATNYTSMTTWIVQRLWQAVRKWEDPATGKRVLDELQLADQVGVGKQLEGVICLACTHEAGGQDVAANRCQHITHRQTPGVWVYADGMESYED